MRISLGTRHTWKGIGAKRRSVIKNDEMFYIPLMSTLQSCFDNENFAEQLGE